MARLGRGSAVAVLLVAVGVLAAANVASATVHQVGGSNNWTVPIPSTNNNYQTWADGQTFAFSDELVFYYPNISHNVMLVNSTAFTACDITDPAIQEWESGEDVIELSQLSIVTPGPEFYFICGEPGHCAAGQKFHITVGSYSPPPAGSTTPTGGSPPPPPPGGGSSRSLPQIGALILTTVMALCALSVL